MQESYHIYASMRLWPWFGPRLGPPVDLTKTYATVTAFAELLEDLKELEKAVAELRRAADDTADDQVALRISFKKLRGRVTGGLRKAQDASDKADDDAERNGGVHPDQIAVDLNAAILAGLWSPSRT